MTFIVLLIGILVGIPLILGFIIMAKYNGLVKRRNRYRNAFSQIDVQLKRRYDLIPNLVEVAKKVMKHENETLTAVIQARNNASQAREEVNKSNASSETITKLMGAETALSNSLGGLFALREDYPDLKSNENMKQLSEEMITTENKLGFARQSYNDSVMYYNNAREVFPNSILANMFNFTPAVFFEVADESEKEALKVSFD